MCIRDRVRTWDEDGIVCPSHRTVSLRHTITPYEARTVAISSPMQFNRSLHTTTPLCGVQGGMRNDFYLFIFCSLSTLEPWWSFRVLTSSPPVAFLMSYTADPAQAVTAFLMRKGLTFAKSPSFRFTTTYLVTAGTLADDVTNLSA